MSELHDRVVDIGILRRLAWERVKETSWAIRAVQLADGVELVVPEPEGGGAFVVDLPGGGALLVSEDAGERYDVTTWGETNG